jgi:urease subunit alpha
VKPEAVLKAGHVAWGALGQGNATVERAEPVRYGPHWGAMGEAAPALSTTFVSRAAMKSGLRDRLQNRRRFRAVEETRTVMRRSLVRNTATVSVEVDPENGAVWLDGRILAADPVAEVPLSRRYLLG